MLASVGTLTPSTNTKSDDDDDPCFSGFEVVYLDSGEAKLIKEVQLGEKILISSLSGDVSDLRYSAVIAKPHGQNNFVAEFVQFTTLNRTTIKMTKEHLVMGGNCDVKLNLCQAQSLCVGQCLSTVTGYEKIADVQLVTLQGVYTLVTKDDGLLVVNGIFASPFARSHTLASIFYNLHRMIYLFSPQFATSPIFLDSAEAFGKALVSVFRKLEYLYLQAA